MAKDYAAWAGLLGGVADLGKDYQKRQQALEDEQLRVAQEMRKEQAMLTRQQALAKFQYDLGADERAAERAHKFTKEEQEAEDKRAEREERKSEREERSKREERQEKRSQESLDIQRKQADKPGELERKLEQIEKSDLSPEEKATAKRNALGATKGNLTEFQESRLRSDLAKLEDTGIDETNIAQVNRLRQQLGEPPLSKKVKTPAKKGILGFGSQDEEVEFTTDQPGGIVSSGGGSEAAAPGLDKYQSMLKQSGGIVEMAGPPPTAPAPPAGETAMTPGEEGGGPLIAPEQLEKLDTMTVPQLQALKMGLLESGDKAAIQSVEGQALLQRINQLIQQKSQLVR